MVSIMQASLVPRHRAPAPSPPTAPARQAGDGRDTQSLGTAGEEQGCRGKAPKAEAQSPPQDSSTCQLWCAMALGALARGRPLDHVGGKISSPFGYPGTNPATPRAQDASYARFLASTCRDQGAVSLPTGGHRHRLAPDGCEFGSPRGRSDNQLRRARVLALVLLCLLLIRVGAKINQAALPFSLSLCLSIRVARATSFATRTTRLLFILYRCGGTWAWHEIRWHASRTTRPSMRRGARVGADYP